ncbi:hypothetical protein Ahy_B01g056312 [Arachis hypogaea]|uniref:Uncharacterized protein n=1 Tax=Arachis hypogaea TaxID=3818 RepID=A0A445AYL1_ARAHY|nr:hypothetical protein Ahy_B01g056312 [Arachis hypogaea]
MPQLKRAFVSRFVNLLEEGISYQIRYFGIGLNKGSFKTTHHEYVVNLNQRTDVHRLLKLSNIPRYRFKFVSFDTLNTPRYDCTYLVVFLNLLYLSSFVRFEESRGNIDGIPNEAAFLKIYQGKTIEQLKELDMDVDYTGGLLPTSKTSSIIEGEKVEGIKNLLLEFSNEVADNDESEVLENAITPTKRLSSKSEDSKVQGDTSTCKKIKIENET